MEKYCELDKLDLPFHHSGRRAPDVRLAAMNAQLFHSLGNRWLASSVSFAVITAFFLCVFAMFPTPLPTAEGLANMPWWAVVGGLVGAVQVYAGITLVRGGRGRSEARRPE